MLNFNTIRARLLTIAIAFVATIFATSSTIFYSQYKLNQYEQIELQIDKVLLDMNTLLSEKDKFLTFDLLDSNFYLKGSTDALSSQILLLESINERLLSLQDNPYISEAAKPIELSLIHLRHYKELFGETVNQYKARGYYDYGLVGEMRSQAHDIEDQISQPENIRSLLLMRRHEKDFFLRRQKKYVNRFLTAYEALNQGLYREDLSEKEKNTLSFILESYKDNFIKVSDIDVNLNQRNGEGLLIKLPIVLDNLTVQINLLASITFG
jgi:hypothetical protein